MIRTLGLSLLLSLSCLPAALAAPPVQLDFPVLALGETAPVRLQLAPHAGGLAAYSIHMNSRYSAVVSGYEVTSVQCPPGFQSNLYGEGRGAVCYRTEDVPHAGGVMVVQVVNVDAPAGHTAWEEGLGFLDAHGPPQNAPWHLFGVRP
ncbi:hypothetical protein MOQ26_20400 [Stenotrophomonas maltophilia]|nr:hypothetical protein [Stenotrophomonas maltophilia]MCI1113409.1 hypothetical protein [Stenotrophomonas maltophilia]